MNQELINVSPEHSSWQTVCVTVHLFKCLLAIKMFVCHKILRQWKVKCYQTAKKLSAHKSPNFPQSFAAVWLGSHTLTAPIIPVWLTDTRSQATKYQRVRITLAAKDTMLCNPVSMVKTSFWWREGNNSVMLKHTFHHFHRSTSQHQQMISSSTAPVKLLFMSGRSSSSSCVCSPDPSPALCMSL